MSTTSGAAMPSPGQRVLAAALAGAYYEHKPISMPATPPPLLTRVVQLAMQPTNLPVNAHSDTMPTMLADALDAGWVDVAIAVATLVLGLFIARALFWPRAHAMRKILLAITVLAVVECKFGASTLVLITAHVDGLPFDIVINPRALQYILAVACCKPVEILLRYATTWLDEPADTTNPSARAPTYTVRPAEFIAGERRSRSVSRSRSRSPFAANKELKRLGSAEDASPREDQPGASPSLDVPTPPAQRSEVGEGPPVPDAAPHGSTDSDDGAFDASPREDQSPSPTDVPSAPAGADPKLSEKLSVPDAALPATPSTAASDKRPTVPLTEGPVPADRDVQLKSGSSSPPASAQLHDDDAGVKDLSASPPPAKSITVPPTEDRDLNAPSSASADTIPPADDRSPPGVEAPLASAAPTAAPDPGPAPADAPCVTNPNEDRGAAGLETKHVSPPSAVDSPPSPTPVPPAEQSLGATPAPPSPTTADCPASAAALAPADDACVTIKRTEDHVAAGLDNTEPDGVLPHSASLEDGVSARSDIADAGVAGSQEEEQLDHGERATRGNEPQMAEAHSLKEHDMGPQVEHAADEGSAGALRQDDGHDAVPQREEHSPHLADDDDDGGVRGPVNVSPVKDGEHDTARGENEHQAHLDDEMCTPTADGFHESNEEQVMPLRDKEHGAHLAAADEMRYSALSGLAENIDDGQLYAAAEILLPGQADSSVEPEDEFDYIRIRAGMDQGDDEVDGDEDEMDADEDVDCVDEFDYIALKAADRTENTNGSATNLKAPAAGAAADGVEPAAEDADGTLVHEDPNEEEPAPSPSLFPSLPLSPSAFPPSCPSPVSSSFASAPIDEALLDNINERPQPPPHNDIDSEDSEPAPMLSPSASSSDSLSDLDTPRSLSWADEVETEEREAEAKRVAVLEERSIVAKPVEALENGRRAHLSAAEERVDDTHANDGTAADPTPAPSSAPQHESEDAQRQTPAPDAGDEQLARPSSPAPSFAQQTGCTQEQTVLASAENGDTHDREQGKRSETRGKRPAGPLPTPAHDVLAVCGRTFDPPFISAYERNRRFNGWDARLVAIRREELCPLSVRVQDNWLQDNCARAAARSGHFRPRPWLRLADRSVILTDLVVRNVDKDGMVEVPAHRRDEELRQYCDRGFLRADGEELVLTSKRSLKKEKAKERRKPVRQQEQGAPSESSRIDPRGGTSSPASAASAASSSSMPTLSNTAARPRSPSSSPSPPSSSAPRTPRNLFAMSLGVSAALPSLARLKATSFLTFITEEDALRRNYSSRQDAKAADDAARENKEQARAQKGTDAQSPHVNKRGRGNFRSSKVGGDADE